MWLLEASKADWRSLVECQGRRHPIPLLSHSSDASALTVGLRLTLIGRLSRPTPLRFLSSLPLRWINRCVSPESRSETDADWLTFKVGAPTLRSIRLLPHSSFDRRIPTDAHWSALKPTAAPSPTGFPLDALASTVELRLTLIGPLPPHSSSLSAAVCTCDRHTDNDAHWTFPSPFLLRSEDSGMLSLRATNRN